MRMGMGMGMGMMEDMMMDGWMDHPLPILINLDVKKWKMEDGRYVMIDAFVGR